MSAAVSMRTPASSPKGPLSDGGSPHYWPLPRRIVVALAVALAVSFILVDLASYAYSRLGLGPGWALAVLLSSVAGSFNIPVAHLRGGTVFEARLVRVWGMLYVIPRVVRTGTKIVAVNLGGAVIPTLLSGYLIVHADLGWITLLAVAFVAAVTHAVARVIPGVGVVVPTFIPPLAAATAAWVFSVDAMAALAYVAGTIGTLVVVTAQSPTGARAGRARRVDRRCGHVRWHLRHRHRRRLARGALIGIRALRSDCGRRPEPLCAYQHVADLVDRVQRLVGSGASFVTRSWSGV